MPVSIIPFNMPEPAAIPPHIVTSLEAMSPDEAVAQGMDLLLGIEAADTIVYERVGQGVVHTAGAGAEVLQRVLEQDGVRSFAGQEGVGNSALLLVGQVSAHEENPLPAGVVRFLLEGAEGGSIGFSYVLPLKTNDGQLWGALTLIRRAASGPLNHEQPNLCEGMRRVLSRMSD